MASPGRESQDGTRKFRPRLPALARFEMPKKIGLLEHDFPIERGELTPTLKVKRRIVDKSYKSLIDSLYYLTTATAPESELESS